MAFPLIIPFAAGVAVGSLVTYGYKDKGVHDRVVHGAQDLYGWLAGGVTAVADRIPYLKTKTEEALEEAKEEIEALRVGAEEGAEGAKAEAAPKEEGGETAKAASETPKRGRKPAGAASGSSS